MTRRVVWLTDIHLNFLGTVQVNRFANTLRAAEPDIVLISGDIGEARTLGWYLKTLEQKLQKPIYFVLGNHDFYMGSVEDVRAVAQRLSIDSQWLVWLPAVGVVELAPDTALVGHDSWADGRYGDYEQSQMLLNDFALIHDLVGLSRDERLRKLNALGDEAASYFRHTIPTAFETYHHVIVLTHVPPFRESCWHNGAISDDDGLPFFACKAVGDVLLEIMQIYPHRQLTVLCGHTHGRGQVQILDNLRVLTGGAEYGRPEVQQIFEF
jgi:predicted MPP superfamily phosphohydrolase